MFVIGKITKIEPQKKNPSRVSIYVDEQFFIGAEAYSVKKNNWDVGKEINEEDVRNLCFIDNLEKGKRYAVDYLMNKPKKVIYDKLKGKGYEEDVINEIISFLLKYNYINDGVYANSFAKDASYIKKQGVNKIKNSLKQKGINDSEIEHALSNIDNEEQYHNAYRKLEKKLDNYRKKAKNSYELKHKASTYLYSQGFQSEIIQRVVEELLSN